MKHPTIGDRLRWTVRSQWHVMAAVLPGVALALMHATMLDVPHSDLVDALDSDKYRVQWIVGSYLLGSATGMALTRWCASRLGLRKAYLLGIVLFSLAGSACGLVNEIVWMTPLRLVQGFGNGLLISVGMVIIWQAFRRREREFAMALYGMAVFVPAVAGVALGGLLTNWLSWRAIFFSNLPMGLIVWLLAWMLLPSESPDRARPKVSLDFVGLFLLAASIITVSVMLDMGQYWGWLTSPHFCLWMTLFIAAFGAFLAWGLWAANPLINLRVFKHRNTTLALVVKMLFSINLYALFGILSLYMINLRGYQWWQAALVATPAVAAMLLAILFNVRIGNDRNRKLRMLIGLAVIALATWQLDLLDVYTSKFWIAGVLAVWGAGAGCVIGPALLTIFEGLPIDEATSLAGVFNILRVLPSYIALTVLASFWTQSTDAQFDTLRQNIRYNRPVVSQSYESSREHFISQGSPRDHSIKQSQALLAEWTHANARAFALQNILRLLALMTAPALLFVLLMQPWPAPAYSTRVPLALPVH